MCKYYIMAKSRKYGKNIMKKKVNRSIRSGGDGDSNPLSGIASSGLSGLSTAAPGGLSAITSVLSNAKMMCGTMTLMAAKKGATSAIGMLNIPREFDTPLQKILGTDATLSDLFIDCINALECNDIDIFIELLPKIFVIDKIGKLLETPNLTGIDEAAKESLPLFKEMKEIISTEKFQKFVCRILRQMESKGHIKSEHKKAFITFYVGPEKTEQICKETGLMSTMNNLGSSISSSMGSLFGSKPANSTNTEPDTRCGESQIVKKSWFSGDYCAPKLNEAPPAVEPTPSPVEKEEEEAPAVEPTPSPVEKEEEAPAVEPTPSPAEKEEEAPAVEPTPSPAEKEGEAPAVEPTPSPAEKEEEAPAGKEGGQKKRGWFWGGKYKRVKHTKKSKKSKSKKSKRSKK